MSKILNVRSGQILTTENVKAYDIIIIPEGVKAFAQNLRFEGGVTIRAGATLICDRKIGGV
jgi:hypothetical protein